MYVIINTHWDRGWLDEHINAADSNKINARQYAYWTQVANTFKNYGDRQVEHIGHSEITSLMSIGSFLKPNMYIVQVSGKEEVKSFKIVKK